jgi:hypothetical protein
MKNIIKLLIVIAIANIMLASCKKDYIIGGKLESTTTNLTTYDYLKSNRFKMFDTLLMLVDKAGIKDVINQKGITFYAPTDFSINNYLTKKTKEAQVGNIFVVYTIDTLIKYDLNAFADSIRMYIIPKTITYSSLTSNGVVLNTAQSGTQAVVSYEQTTDPNLGYNPVVTTIPQVEYYSRVIGTLPRPIVSVKLSDSVAIRVLCQTSGLTTATGQLNVLSNSHTLYFKQ